MINTYLKQKTAIALMFLCLFFSGITFAQTIFVGNGTINNTDMDYPAPYGNWYGGARHQFLVLASELTGAGASAGDITELGFDVVTPNGVALQNFEIKMMPTTLTDLTAFQPGTISYYTNAAYTDVAGWNMHTLSMPFNWDGTSNIIIETCFNNLTFTNNAVFNQTATLYASSVFYYEDNQAAVCSINTLGFPAPTLQKPNMAFTFSPSVPCIDPPTAGSANASSNPVCTGTSFTLSLQGNSTGSGQTYQWQSSPDNLVWNPIIGATNSAYLATQTADTYYRCLVTCGLSSVPSSSIFVTLSPVSQCYCAAGSATCDEFISNVQVAGISNPTACGTGGYTDHTSIVIPMEIGVDHPILVSNGPPVYADDQCGIWVDWNHDGDFYDTDEAITVSGSPSIGPYSAVINPPAGAMLGQTVMRIRITWLGVVDPCGITAYGEVEDYMVNVLPAPPCPPPTGMTITNITASSADLNWTAAPLAVNGYQLRWKAVSDPTTVPTWQTPTLLVTTNYNLTGLLGQTQYEVQIASDCGAGGMGNFTSSYYFTTACANTACPVGALIEGEACGSDANGGCNMAVPAYEPIACGETICGTAWSNGGTRDTDWFTFTLSQPSTVTWTVDADFPAIIGFVDAGQGCAAPQFFNLTFDNNECGHIVTLDNLAAGTWWLFVAPFNFAGYPCGSGENKYVANLTCVPLATAANDNCAGALPLVSGTSCIPVAGSVDNATQTITGCAGTANDDVWYSFVATATAEYIQVAGSSNFDPVFEVFDACNGASMGCTNATGVAGTELNLVAGLTIGNTYYIRVYDFGLGIPVTTGFDICVYEAAGNYYIMNNTNEVTCSGTFFDSGALGFYADNENYTKTFTPSSPNSLISMNFTSFAIEDGWDFLTIFDGPTTASPQIGTYTGLTGPGLVTATNPTGELTFLFTSDFVGTDIGWEATISCVSSLNPPPCADNLTPVDLATNVNPNPTLTWTPGLGSPATGYDVYFGAAPNPPLVSANQPGTSYNPGLLSFNTMYYWKVVPLNANGAATGCPELSFTTGNTIVYCPAGSLLCDEFISNVTFGAVNNPSTCGTGGYTDYTSITEPVSQGLAYPITIGNGPPTYTADQCGIWADWNHDGDFYDAGEAMVVNGTPGPGPYTGLIDVPLTAQLGATRMRIRITWTGIVDPCGITDYGEVEDYTLDVQPAPFCPYPGGLTVTNLTNTSATLDWNDVPGAVNYLVRYKMVTDPITVGSWATPTVVAAPTTDLALSGLTGGTDYEYQVQTECSTTPFTFSSSYYFTTMLDPCPNTVCPPGAISENEACGSDANGGCNMVVPFYTPISCGDTICGTSWSDGGTRDTDWFTFTLTQPSTVTWTVDADFPAVIGFVDASQGCAAPVFFNLTQTFGECEQAVTLDNLAAGTWWVFIATNNFAGYPCGGGRNNYVANLSCVPLVVADNDECATAMMLTQNATCINITDSVANATQSITGCSGTANDDVWFSFVATSVNPVIEVQGAGAFDAVIEIFDACGGNSLGCVDVAFAGGLETAALNGLVIGNTYYFRVYDFNLGIPADNSFTVCVHDLPPPPANDECATAIMLTQDANCNPTPGTGFLATQSQPGCTGTANDDVWYSFVATTTNPVVELQGIGGYDGVLEVFDACGGTSLACVDGTFGGGLEIAFLTGLTIGNTYYFRAFDWFNTSGNLQFTVCVHDLPPPPANDDCVNAIAVNCNTGTITGSTLLASADAATTCGTTIDAPGVWYTFTGNGQPVTVSLCGGTNYDSKLNIYSGDCANLICENGNDDFCGVASEITVPTVSGTNYYILVQGFSGNVGNFTLDVYFTPAQPVVTASGPLNFCQGDSVILTSSVSGVTWSNGSTLDSITVLISGNYYNSYTDAAGCNATSDTSVVMVYDLPQIPVITPNGPTTFCDGGSVLLGSNYTTGNMWSTGDTSQTIGASMSNAYTVTYTDSNGCSSTSLPVDVVVNPLPPTPLVSPYGPVTVCSGTTLTLTSSEPNGNTWSDLSTGGTLDVTVSGMYYTIVTDSNGCVSDTSNMVDVVVNPLPDATIMANGPVIVCGGGTADLMAMASGLTYNWSNGDTTQTITVSVAGAYTCTVTDLNGCSATSSPITLGFFPAPSTPTITPLGNTTFCAGGSVDLLSSPASQFNWNNGPTSQTITVNSTGSYTVTTTDTNGCTAVSAPMNVTVNPNPVVSISAGGPTTFCLGSNVTLSSTATSGNLWTNQQTTASITVTLSGTYSTTVTDSNGCSATSNSIVVTVDSVVTPVITANGPLNLCNGATVDLTSSSPVSNSWSNGSQQQTITVSTAGTYTVMVTGTTGCTATSNAITVTVGIAGGTPYIIPGGPTIICEDETVQLLSSVNTGNVWSNGDTSAAIFVNQTGNYTVTVTYPGGCTATSASIPVVVNPLPTASFTYNAIFGGQTNFTNTSANYLTSQWDFGDGSAWSNSNNPVHTYQADGVYTVVLTVSNDCGSVTSTQQITIVGTGIEAPEAGTSLDVFPNPSDGLFQVNFTAPGNRNLSVRVVDLNGQVVYNESNIAFNGSLNKEIDLNQAAKGVYFLQLVTDKGIINRKLIVH